MFYRRKIVMALLQTFGGSLDKINLYKLLFLVTKQQQRPEYDFIPYKFGCYSFSLHADMVAMYKHSLLKDDDKAVSKLDNKNYLTLLKEADGRIINNIYKRFANSTADDLMRYTYIQFPYSAINSLTKERLLTPAELEAVKAAIPVRNKTVLYTIGYEGVSLEDYLNKLILNDVKVLVDVRRNALSMKFGFSKSQLNNYCSSLGIEYIHIPEVGIQADLRQELKTQHDYDKLFIEYRKTNLTNTGSYQQKILELLIAKQRIALTCFEANICQCHRTHLADAITRLPGWRFELKHI